MISYGNYRHLSQCSSDDGVFVVLAVDHRANLVSDMEKAHMRTVMYDEVVAFKAAVIHHLLPEATALLTDPDYGFPGTLALTMGRAGLLAPLEVTDYTIHPRDHAPRMIEGWGVAKAKRAGCSGVKLLLYFHPQAADAPAKIVLVEQIVAECAEVQIPLFLEPIVHALDDLVYPMTRTSAIIEAARVFAGRFNGVLKMQFPGEADDDEVVWRASLAELDAACGATPWALLSGGVGFPVFLRQAELACQAGASGVIAGRAVWAEAAALEGEAREHFLADEALQRLQQLRFVCQQHAKPWTVRVGQPNVDRGWYLQA
ncbi:MAG: tagatose 1,6-diphosphate aldolase [Blastochloris sp.]|nr:tagatose 1,6-diphosphate aldolase [Blastochloris sp.]